MVHDCPYTVISFDSRFITQALYFVFQFVNIVNASFDLPDTDPSKFDPFWLILPNGMFRMIFRMRDDFDENIWTLFFQFDLHIHMQFSEL